MNKYLLLRDNKQTGPHSIEEMLELGFRKYDLVWVEGKSAAWRYPGELAEFKEIAPLVEEQPFDRFYKRAVSSEQEAVSRREVGGGRREEAVSRREVGGERREEAVSENNTIGGITHEEIEKRRTALAESKLKQDDSKYLPKEKNEPVSEVRASQTAERHRKVAITMPANRRLDSIVTPTPKKQEAEPRIVPVPAAAPVAERLSNDVPPVVKAEIRSVSNTRDYTQYLQYAGVAAALISLLVIGILIGMGISTDTTLPAPVISEQPSRINELKEKLSITAAAEPAATEVQNESLGVKAAKSTPTNKPAKNDPVTIKEATPVSASYQTSEAPPPATNEGKREAVKRETAASSNLSEMISLTLNDYKINMFGGIDGIEVSVKNGADVSVEEVVVELRYILSNKNKKYISETVKFNDLKPGETKTLPGPKSNRGIKLEPYIVSAR